MPRYFFIVTYPDQREIGDPLGTQLPNDAAAIESAVRIIDALREDRLPEESEPAIILTNDGGEIIYRFPAR
jgi:hypothetical protein